MECTVTIKIVVICSQIPTFILSSSFCQRFTKVLVCTSPELVKKVSSICSDDTLVCSKDMYDDEAVMQTVRMTTVGFVDGTINAGDCEWMLGMGIRVLCALRHLGEYISPGTGPV